MNYCKYCGKIPHLLLITRQKSIFVRFFVKLEKNINAFAVASATSLI